MFKKTHRSLTKYYVTMTVILFTIMVMCFLALMTFTIYSDEKLEALAFAKEEATEYITVLEMNEFNPKNMFFNALDDEDVSIDEIHNALRMFSFIKLPDGQIQPLTFVTRDIEQWSKNQILTNDFSEPILLTYKLNNDHFRLFFVKHDIFKEGKFYGTIYAGKDATIIWSILRQMLVVSVLLIICFTILLFFFGSRFAAKAMHPVEDAILRQKQFITDASHELRTPLSVMLAGTELIRTDAGQSLNQENVRILRDIQDEIRKMSKLVESLLSLSKIDEGGIDIPKEGDVVKIVALTIDKLLPLAEKKNIKLSLLNNDSVIWYANNEILAQILYILLDNAIKYTQDGGQVMVGVQVLVKKGRQLLLTVEDNGIGITDDEQERIFERFYRVDKARTRQAGGSGLGLAIVWALVEKHGGKIEVDSALGKGSLFKVILPEMGR